MEQLHCLELASVGSCAQQVPGGPRSQQVIRVCAELGFSGVGNIQGEARGLQSPEHRRATYLVLADRLRNAATRRCERHRESISPERRGIDAAERSR